MPRLGVSKEFFAEFTRLEAPVRRAVQETFGKFEQHTHAGLHLEKINNSRDPRARTIRIGKFWRGVVLAPEHGDEYCLVTVLPHDEAIAFARSRVFSVNAVLGVLEMSNADALDAMKPALTAIAGQTDERLYTHVKDVDLQRLGIEDKYLPLVRTISDEAVLMTLANIMPTTQYEVLTGLAAGMTVEQVWAEVAADLEAAAVIDTADIGTAMTRTRSRIVVVETGAELTEMLARPFSAWRTFLHPLQRALAYRTGYSGPVQVTGSAGTGKTVTALHRVAHLASSPASGGAAAASGEYDDIPDILLTTYSTTLARNLTDALTELVDDEGRLARIDVLNIDKIAARTVAADLGRMPNIADRAALNDLWSRVHPPAVEHHSAEFLHAEWERVVLAQGIDTLDGYLTAPRTGRGIRLTGAQKATVWAAVEQFTALMREAGLWTHLTVAARAARLTVRDGPRYRHIVVDEAQDLHPAQWRLLRALAPAAADDLFIVGDANQQIYGGRVSLRAAGVNVIGRSRRLTVCYRSTREILAWASAILHNHPATSTAEADDTLDGYRSALSGSAPTLAAAATRGAEFALLIGRIQSWLSEGIDPYAIAVAARTNHLAELAAHALRAAGVATAPLGSTDDSASVHVGTMHRLKGLEFRCVAVVGAEDGIIPHARAVTPECTDPLAHAEDLQRERCVLFVACTRARDALYVSYAGSPSPFLPVQRDTR